ncbi:MAG: thioesterase family protein [Moraxellaceae bacterium]|nr:thioesterase family protein [Moraxellaceae bacterium]
MSAYYHLLERTELTKDDEIISIAHYQSTIHTQGTWNDHEQHMAPVTGLICHEMERFFPRDDCRIGRISIDILGIIPFGNIELSTRFIRSGRTIELIETTVTSHDKIHVIARTWRMATTDTCSVEGVEDNPIAPPESFPDVDILHKWGGGFLDSLSARIVSQPQVGKGIIWVTNDINMVAQDDTSDFVRLMGLVDIANGIGARIDASKKQWVYPNLDLQIHMYRQPQGKWLGIEATQQIGSDGIGLTSSVLHDVSGAFGRCEQIITVRKI